MACHPCCEEGESEHITMAAQKQILLGQTENSPVIEGEGRVCSKICVLFVSFFYYLVLISNLCGCVIQIETHTVLSIK